MIQAPVTDTLNRPLRDLRISVTDRCNFRCPYCMPEEVFGANYQFLRRGDLLGFEEIARLARLFSALGVSKIRLTGGEPLLRQSLPELVKKIATIKGVDDFALTTNGVLLPKFAGLLKDAGLQRVTVSLDSLDEAVFRQMSGNRATVQEVLAGLESAKKAGLAPIKINAVVQRGVNDHTIVDLARFCRDNGYILRFIEYMDVGNNNGWQLKDVVPAKEIVERIQAVFPLERLARTYASETAFRYQYKDGQGEMGIIASVTVPFCGDCTRLRLSPNGMLYTCLFGTHGTDLRTPMREEKTDAEISEIIRALWAHRTDRYSEIRSHATGRQKVEMHHIGG